ncbi:DNA polymerase delta subunit 2-like isoform X1 [Cotesia glomerata]|uniref:DNA polymerase delta subunit 2-like isoform X1 n=1 Tax=Cotesia glomerata TaxID=32391 RepID=UPI001D01712F|nr:DNA polymerase delta subunit 2-like isoform X1 [Cotesia glomerata]
MSEFSAMDNAEIKIERTSIEFEDFKKFIIGDRKFDKQYSNIYIARLRALKNILENKSKEKWGQYQVKTISQLGDDDDDESKAEKLVILIGIIYKHQELKPSILKELSDELQLIPQLSRSNYSSEKDQLFLEDEMLRVKLVGSDLNHKEMVTGLICGVLGYQSSGGIFNVKDYCVPGICPQASECSPLMFPSEDKILILLLSGLDLSGNPDSLHYQLLSEWISGMAGNNQVQENSAFIAQVIIAGNSIKGSVETYTHKGYVDSKNKFTATTTKTILATRRFDTLLSEIVSTSNVILMPGQFDPSNHSIPQQPFHPSILPLSFRRKKNLRYKSLYAATNPWIGKIGSRILAGSSGQPIEDIMKVANLNEYSPIDWLEKSLYWRHFAPTAPDTLAAYPYVETDPFIMDECPDIYFVGNTNEYATKCVTGDQGQTVRLICIPKFSKTHTAVVVDLLSLDTWPITFQN